MKVTKPLAFLATLALGVTLAPLAGANAPDWDPEMDLGSGTTVYVTENAIQNGVKDECLAAIKKWRQDALDTDVKWTDPTGSQTMREYLAANSISEADYLNPQWSLDMEYIAIERALEAYTHITGYSHDRPNGDDTFSLKHGGIGPWQEAIARGRSQCADAIDQFAGEKTDWVNNTGEETGHYKFLIDPSILHYGFAGFVNSDDSTIKGSPRWVGEAAPGSVSDTSATELSGLHTFPINLSDADIAQGGTLSPERVQVGKETPVMVRTKAHDGKFFFRGTFVSSDEAIAKVTDSGRILGVSEGSVTLTFTPNGNGTPMDFTFTVWDRHITEVANPAGVETPSGTVPTLPSTVSATFDNGDVEDVEVVWEEHGKDYYTIREGGTVTVKGTVEGWDTPVEIEVTVLPATPVSADITHPEITIESGDTPTLDAVAHVVWSDGTETDDEAVTWDEVADSEYSKREGNTVTVNGTVAGMEDAVTTTVTVNPATIVSVENPRDTTTPVEIIPFLPETVSVTWSNDDVSDEAVAWDEITAEQVAEAGEFMVNGTVEGWADPVLAKVIVKDEHITSAAFDPAEATITAGDRPEIPTDVKVMWSDGSETTDTIIWDAELDETVFDTPGDVVLSGHIQGYDEDITFTYHVVAAEQPDDDTTDPGTDTGSTPGDNGKQPSPHDPTLPHTGFASQGLALAALGLLGAGALLLRRRTS